jgi:parallel beta-helix repeat protein
VAARSGAVGVALFLALPAAGLAQAAAIVPARGLVVTRSVRVKPGVYRLSAPASLDSAVITIRGNHLTIDLRGVELQGLDPTADPDQAAGVALRIEGGSSVRVLGGRLRGYKVGVLARRTRGLSLTGVDASDNWKPRLWSVVEHESLADWLSFHHNEQDEWLRYGAAFYLADVRGGALSGNRAERGMNGILLVRSDSLRVSGNDLSFNSGLGLGLYRSSDNSIVRNRLDYNVRGYSHGFYHRGQDSAGLLLYEQSSRNVVAWNSATHGGDGLFLWAGQTTMDTGDGGANDNLFYANDFSFAPANAMEATFSRNDFIANLAAGSDYGLWGGYSYGSRIVANCLAGNRTGIAIEHGQENRIAANRFRGDSVAIYLWGDPIEPSDWGYPKHRDTKSREYRIEDNRFEQNRVALRARNTAGLSVRGNRFAGVDSVAVLRDTSGYTFLSNQTAEPITDVPCEPGALPAQYAALTARAKGLAGPVPGSAAARRDRSAIIVDAWGPYDWRTPKLWPVDSTRAVPLGLRVLGPAGSWRVVSREGVAGLLPTSGRVGDTLRVTPSNPASWRVELEYHGPAGSPQRFGYGRFEPAIQWSARFFSWSDSTDLRSDSTAFARMARQTPLLERTLSRLDFEWYRPQLGLPLERWALEATGSVELPPGRYQLRSISDDGIRVWIDGALAIDRWSVHESAVDSAPLAAGRHDLRVQYFQADGWTELRVEISAIP